MANMLCIDGTCIREYFLRRISVRNQGEFRKFLTMTDEYRNHVVLGECKGEFMKTPGGYTHYILQEPRKYNNNENNEKRCCIMAHGMMLYVILN